MEQAAQAIAEAFNLLFGDVAIRVRAGKVILVEATHQLRAEDAAKMRV